MIATKTKIHTGDTRTTHTKRTREFTNKNRDEQSPNGEHGGRYKGSSVHWQLQNTGRWNSIPQQTRVEDSAHKKEKEKARVKAIPRAMDVADLPLVEAEDTAAPKVAAIERPSIGRIA